MPAKFYVITLAGAIVLGSSSFLITYGIKGGLIEKRVLVNRKKNLSVTGRQAVLHGLLYIAIGVISIVIYVIAVIKSMQ